MNQRKMYWDKILYSEPLSLCSTSEPLGGKIIKWVLYVGFHMNDELTPAATIGLYIIW